MPQEGSREFNLTGRSWVIIGSDSKVAKIFSEIAPLQHLLERGQRFSYIATLKAARDTSKIGTILQLRVGSAEGHMEAMSLGNLYRMSVVGENVEEMKEVIARFEQELGARDLTPRTSRLLPGLPRLASAWQRLVFILRYIAYGEVEPSSAS